MASNLCRGSGEINQRLIHNVQSIHDILSSQNEGCGQSKTHFDIILQTFGRVENHKSQTMLCLCVVYGRDVVAMWHADQSVITKPCDKHIAQLLGKIIVLSNQKYIVHLNNPKVFEARIVLGHFQLVTYKSFVTVKNVQQSEKIVKNLVEHFLVVTNFEL